MRFLKLPRWNTWSVLSRALRGEFAVKESCKKIFNDLSWLDIEVVKDPSGKPRVLLVGKEFLSGDVSISHDGEYAIAVVISME
ncbi:MAG: hypothetical protein IH796_08675 [Deltaproteobacteria bacterium]|nr:hypothetical protein [Deltaproteobacteria bacterium]